MKSIHLICICMISQVCMAGKSLIACGETISHKFPGPSYGALLSHTSRKGTKTISRTSELQFVRLHIDTVFGRKDTIWQVITGRLESLEDSVIRIYSYSFYANNDYSMSRLDAPNYKKQHFSIKSRTDTLLVFPARELYSITFPAREITRPYSVIAINALNLVACPFYSINYETFKFNSLLFRNSFYTSIAVITESFIEIALAPKDDVCILRSEHGRKNHWILKAQS